MRAPLLTVLSAFVVIAMPAFAALAAAPDRGEVERKDTFRDAATAPLEDLNLKQLGVPEALARARSAPYDVVGLDRCEAIAEEIGRLDGALGRDLDEAPPPDTRTQGQRIGGAVKDVGVAGVRTETQGVLPFRGWIRKLTGAEAAQKKRDAAIQAGRIRRGYLKGVGMRMNCAPPAAPSWFVPTKTQPLGAAGFSLQGLWLKIVAWFWSWWPF
jgi:hypothetical protein